MTNNKRERIYWESSFLEWQNLFINERDAKNEFQFQPNKYNGKRTIRMAIPESVDPQYLIQELNSKFYQSLST